MIRNTRRGFNTFGLTPDDDAYETGQRSTTALELRVFGEEANSRLQNWGKERGRDKGIEVADTYVISNTNPENKVPGWGDEGHSGVVILNRKGDRIGPFGPVEKTAFPSRLNDALERAKRYKDKF